MKYFIRAVCGFVGLSIAALPSLGFAQSSAPVPAPQSPPVTIQTAPYISLRLNVKPTSVVSAGTVLEPGQALATYSITPRAFVRTSAASIARNAAFPPSLPANTPLFEVGLEGITGYCAVRTRDQGERQSQCFIDVNNDNKFDASYITNRAWYGQALYWGQVARLASIPPVPYETVAVDTGVTEPMSYFFKRLRNQRVEIQIGLGPRNNGLPVRTCAIDASTPCRLAGHVFTFEAVGTRLRVLSMNEANDLMDIVFDR